MGFVSEIRLEQQMSTLSDQQTPSSEDDTSLKRTPWFSEPILQQHTNALNTAADIKSPPLSLPEVSLCYPLPEIRSKPLQKKLEST